MATRKAASSKSQARRSKTVKSQKTKGVAPKRAASAKSAKPSKASRSATAGSNQLKSKDKAAKTKAKKVGASKKVAKPAKKKAARSARTGKPPSKTQKTVRKASPSLRKTSKAQRSTKKKSPPRKESVKTRASNFSAALKVYEAGLKLMHAEAYEKAKAKFGELTQRFTDEMELLDRTNVLIQACDQRIREKRSAGPKLKTADDYYEVAIAEMNSRRLDIARDHLNAALKRSPKADHVLYALAAVSALSDERDDALEYLKKSIQYRDKNRFLAVNDTDLESLFEDPEFIELIKPEES